MREAVNLLGINECTEGSISLIGKMVLLRQVAASRTFFKKIYLTAMRIKLISNVTI